MDDGTIAISIRTPMRGILPSCAATATPPLHSEHRGIPVASFRPDGISSTSALIGGHAELVRPLSKARSMSDMGQTQHMQRTPKSIDVRFAPEATVSASASGIVSEAL
jgi:hypothetical protein